MSNENENLTVTAEEALPDINGAEAENIILAVLFAAGHPLEYSKIGKLFGATPAETKRKISEFAEKFNGFKIFVAAVFVGNPLAVLSAVVKVEH